MATYFRRRTTREAARLLGLTPGAAKARLYQAMRDLSDMVAIGWPEARSNRGPGDPDPGNPLFPVSATGGIPEAINGMGGSP